MKLMMPPKTRRERTQPKGPDSPPKTSPSVSHPRKLKSPQSLTKSYRYVTRSQVKKTFSRNTVDPCQRFSSPPIPESELPLDSVHFPKTKVTVAFSDGDYDPTAILPRILANHVSSTFSDAKDREITHVIRLSHLSASVPRQSFQRKYPPKVRHGYRNGLAWSDYDVESGVATLDLVIPRKSSSTTRLTESQLKLAQGFLDLVFLWPTDPPGYPSHLKPRVPNVFHILITAPNSVSQPRKAKIVHENTDSILPCARAASLSQASRDILAVIGDRLEYHSDIDAQEGLLFLEETSGI